MNTSLRSLVFWMVLVVVVVMIWNFSSNLGQTAVGKQQIGLEIRVGEQGQGRPHRLRPVMIDALDRDLAVVQPVRVERYRGARRTAAEKIDQPAWPHRLDRVEPDFRYPGRIDRDPRAVAALRRRATKVSARNAHDS